MKPTLLTALVTAMSIVSAAPPTEKKPVTDEYHGVKVVDDYRWLEESGSPAVKAWTDAQNKHSRAWLDARPDRADIEAKLTALYAKDTPSHGGHRVAAGTAVCAEIPATEAAAAARHAGVGG